MLGGKEHIQLVVCELTYERMYVPQTLDLKPSNISISSRSASSLVPNYKALIVYPLTGNVSWIYRDR